MINGEKNRIRFIPLFLILFFFCALFSRAQIVTTELLNISAESDSIVLEVAKRYPDIKFDSVADKNQISIELVNSKYHTSFKVPDKQLLLSVLDYLSDVSVEETKNGADISSVKLLLTLEADVSCIPKLQSTKNNIVRITLNKKEKSNVGVEVEPEQSMDFGIVEIYNTAVAEQKKGNLDKSEELYKKVISIDNKFYLARFNLAKIYIDKKLYEQALTILESLIKDLPDDLQNQKALSLFQNTLGTIYYFINSDAKAIEQYESVLKTTQDFYQAYYNIGLIYEKTNKLKQAKKNFLKVIELNSVFSDAYYHLAVLQLISNEEKEAIISFNKVVELAPQSELAKLSQRELDKLGKK